MVQVALGSSLPSITGTHPEIAAVSAAAAAAEMPEGWSVLSLRYLKHASGAAPTQLPVP